MTGIFTVSLDFELHWGSLNKKDRIARMQCYQNTLQLIPRMLDLFAQYGVHVTWATVGSLFARDEEEWRSLKPDIEPEYEDIEHSSYQWVNKNGLAAMYKEAHFAPEEVQLILQYPGQELGTHTFSHYYCTEPQKRPEAFAADLRAAKKAAEKFGVKLTSLVFPRNRFNDDNIRTCFNEGVKVVRINPSNWLSLPASNMGEKLVKKVCRKVSSLLPLGEQLPYSTQEIKFNRNEALQVPNGRFFTPWIPSDGKTVNACRLLKLKREMQVAAIHHKCYHIWWHPENFGDYPEENMARLTVLLKHFQYCKERYGMQSWNMAEYMQLFPEISKNVITTSSQLFIPNP